MWSCSSRSRAVLLKHHAPYKAWGIVISELCRASTEQHQLCTCSSPLLESTCPATRQNHAVGQRDGRRHVYPSFNAVHAIGRACCPGSLSFQLRRRRAGLGAWAAAFGCSLWLLGILLGLCAESTGEDAIEGEGCLASTRVFEYFFCLFLKLVLTAKLKAFSAAAEIYSL